VLTITSDADAYALDVVDKLRNAGINADADLRNEKISYKVREHSVAKVPVLMAVGQREVDEETVALRRLGSTRVERRHLGIEHRNPRPRPGRLARHLNSGDFRPPTGLAGHAQAGNFARQEPEFRWPPEG
jgi:histidyl-tRNA synthetase